MGYRFVPDKFGESGMTPLPSETVRPPRVAECPLQLEARVVALHRSQSELGADSFAIVETQVTRVHAHSSIVHPGTSYIDVEAWRPLFYVFRHYFSTGSHLGQNFRAERPPTNRAATTPRRSGR
jgi:flavin reductase (DIM6/NTAB) family NADH-FMN oxidoreductase RutF